METALIKFPLLGEGFVLNPPSSVTFLGFDLRFYGLIIALGFILAAVYALIRCRDFGLTQDNILDMVICAIPSGVIGARIYYVIFQAGDYFGPGKWLNIIRIWEGGLAIYGGILASFAAVFIYSRVKRIEFGKLCDVGGLGLLIGQAVGRWGNFVNREVYGAQTDVPWRMVLTDGSRSLSVHPAFLYESLWNIIGFIVLHFFSKKHKKYHGQIFLMYVAWYGFGRFLIEGIRDYDDVLKIGGDLRVSQLLAALTFVAAVVLLVRNHRRGLSLAPVAAVTDAETETGAIPEDMETETGDTTQTPEDDGQPEDEPDDVEET